MPLSKDIIRRLTAKFKEFQQTRDYIHELLHNYVNDYKNFQGSPDDRKEFLEEIYGTRAAKISHLLFENDDRKIYWHVQDIAIIMGRDTTTIRRTFKAMFFDEEWRTRLEELRKPSKSANNNNIYVYHEDIFDLILDHYEKEYLLRFSQPRHGEKINAPDFNEIKKFWDYLKNSYSENFDFETNNDNEDFTELSEIPNMFWNDVFALIWKKILTVKTGIIFSIFFAFTFETARRFSFMVYYFFAISVLLFFLCMILLRFRKSRADIISDLGAVALLFVFSWGAALMSDGIIYTPTGAALTLKKNTQKLVLQSELHSDKQVNFRISSSSYGNIKEIYYRISPDKDFRLTGFNDLNYPLLIIEPKQQYGILNIDLKFKNTDSEESEVFNFEFDMDKERFSLSKKFVLYNGYISVSSSAGINYVNLYTHSRIAKNVIKSIAYGINKDTTDKVFQIPEFSDRDNYVLERTDRVINYVTSYLIFKDGTSSDILKTEAKKKYF